MNSKGVMGLFDIVRSSFDLGPDFTECECQTKDIEELGGSLTFYWLSPDGHLYTPNYDGTADFEVANDPHASLFNSFRIVETGKKGLVQAVYISKTIKIYPAKLASKFEPIPEMELKFKEGKLVSYSQVVPKRVSSEHVFWKD